MASGKLLYAQSGGPSPVINATASAVLSTAREHGIPALAARNGIIGVLAEDLIDTSPETPATLEALRHTPGAAFGSCRYKLPDADADAAGDAQRILEVLRAHDVRWFLYNGGNDSADTTLKLARLARQAGDDLTCVGVPKTVDNDLAVTDNSPGFGSVARYLATSLREAGRDVASMCSNSTQVFVLEVMGRHAGWLAAATGMAGEDSDAPPHVIVFPERAFDADTFLERVQATVARVGYCTVVTAEGAAYADGTLLADAGTRDAFGHVQLGGAAPAVADLVTAHLGMKVHWAVPDYLQRAASHAIAQTDRDQAEAVGRAAVEHALAGDNAVMPVIQRDSDQPYRWHVEPAALSRIANRERKVPKHFIRPDGFSITPAARRYLAPLLRGQVTPPLNADDLPRHAQPENRAVRRKLAARKSV